MVVCGLALSPPTGRTQSCCPTNMVHAVIFREEKLNQTTGSELVHPCWVKFLTSLLTTGAESSSVQVRTTYSFIYYFIYSTTTVEQIPMRPESSWPYSLKREIAKCTMYANSECLNGLNLLLINLGSGKSKKHRKVGRYNSCLFYLCCQV